MKILIASDAHDRWDYLKLAIEKGNQAGCGTMLFAGDLISPGGVKMLEQFNGPVHIVLGNNEGEIIGLTQWIGVSKNITLHYKFGQSIFTETIAGLRFYMNHFPPFVRNAALAGDYDVCVYGHNHVYAEEVLENGTILLNPGEVQGYKTGVATCMIFDTDTKEVQKVALT